MHQCERPRCKVNHVIVGLLNWAFQFNVDYQQQKSYNLSQHWITAWSKQNVRVSLKFFVLCPTNVTFHKFHVLHKVMYLCVLRHTSFNDVMSCIVHCTPKYHFTLYSKLPSTTSMFALQSKLHRFMAKRRAYPDFPVQTGVTTPADILIAKNCSFDCQQNMIVVNVDVVIHQTYFMI